MAYGRWPPAVVPSAGGELATVTVALDSWGLVARPTPYESTIDLTSNSCMLDSRVISVVALVDAAPDPEKSFVAFHQALDEAVASDRFSFDITTVDQSGLVSEAASGVAYFAKVVHDETGDEELCEVFYDAANTLLHQGICTHPVNMQTGSFSFDLVDSAQLTVGAAQFSVERCPADYYFDDDKPTGDKCELCVKKVTCEAGSKVSDWLRDPGLWRTDDNSKQLEVCPFDDGCRSEGSGSGNELCSVAYTGVLCAVCATMDNGGDAKDDYYASGDQCKKCKGDSAGIVTTFFLFLLLAVPVLAIPGCAKRAILKDSYDKLAALRTRFFAELWGVAKSKVVFSAYQIIASTSR